MNFWCQFIVFIVSIKVNAINMCNLSTTFFDSINSGCGISICKYRYEICSNSLKNYVGVCDKYKSLTYTSFDNKDNNFESTSFFSSCQTNINNGSFLCTCDDKMFDTFETTISSCNVSDELCMKNKNKYGIISCICDKTFYYRYDSETAVGQYIIIVIPTIFGLIGVILLICCFFDVIKDHCERIFKCCINHEYDRIH